ncbi:MAG: LD-carboxypeptidase [Candidatus Obscuribacter sp.]|nr:LD-carboxypeptidase [Candidatus Obscuribacter sp.]
MQALKSDSPIKPKVLKKGDTVGIIAPSSPTFDAGNLEFTLNWLKSLGLKYKLGKHTFASYSSYAGADELRLEDCTRFCRQRGAGCHASARWCRCIKTFAAY